MKKDTASAGAFVPAAQMNGLGNEILILDMRARNDSPPPRRFSAGKYFSAQERETAHKISADTVLRLARNPHIAFDQIMIIYDKSERLRHHPYKVEIRNRDGTQAKACGNGARCLAEYLWREQMQRQEDTGSIGDSVFYFITLGGAVTAKRHAGGMVTVAMGKPDFTPEALPLNFIPEDMLNVPALSLLPSGAVPGETLSLFPAAATLLSIGNPHAVFFLPKRRRGGAQSETDTAAAKPLPLAEYPLNIFGAALEKSPAFPQGVNISLAEVVSPASICLRVWERGAGLTKACGTAACATAIAAYKHGMTGAQTAVTLPGGTLHIALDAGGCMMSGPTEFEADGFINLQTGAFERNADRSALR